MDAVPNIPVTFTASNRPVPSYGVLVTTKSPYNSKGIYEAVNVIGIFNTESTTTQLAEIGYTLLADSIEPYGS